MKRLSVRLFAALVITSAVVCQATSVSAQPATEQIEAEPAKADNAVKQTQIQELLKRLEKVETELQQLKKANGGNIPAGAQDQKVVTLLESPYLGMTYNSPNGVRYFAARLILVNLTAKPITIKREQINLEADGTAFKLEDVPATIQGYSFRIGNQSHSLRNLKPATQLKIASGGTASTWVVFANLPKGNRVPKLVLQLDLGDAKKRGLDVNQYALRQLELNTQRMGPKNSLALLTIGGDLNTLNIGNLISEMDRLVEQKVARVAIAWTDSAPQLESNLLSWLQQSALQAGRGQYINAQFPTIPVTIGELHLAAIPNYRTSTTISSSYQMRVHKTVSDAVAASLRSAYQTLPRDDLLNEIKNGDPITRSAALSTGGGRLAAENLPLILQYADDNDQRIQRGALTALRHFGDPKAVEKLLHYARKNADPLATISIDSLAGSRYAAAHTALLTLLKDDETKSKNKIVQILAKHPRPIWSDTIYEFVKNPHEGTSVEALRALVRIGHPKIIDVLEDTLNKGDASMKSVAFAELVSRTDERSEQIAMTYALKSLETSMPDSQVTRLLTRTKDRRAIPLLLKHFAKSTSNRQSIISLLSQIGDQTVGDEFVKQYPNLKNYEQAAVLTALYQMKSPKFMTLAKTALTSSDSSVTRSATQGLQAQATPAATAMLIEALNKTGNQSTVSYVISALTEISSPDAKVALRGALNSTDNNKRTYARNALRNIYQRSPGYQFVAQARNFIRQNDWKNAMAHYTLALKIDPQLPDAYAGRGNAQLKQNKIPLARKDFQKGYELDNFNSQAVTGLAVVLVLEGNQDAGVKFIEAQRKKFTNDPLFAYNAACVYGRSLEALNKQETSAERDALIETYKHKSIADLKYSVKRGFRDFDWMKKDPDLNSLHGFPEFQEIHTPNAKKKPATPQQQGAAATAETPADEKP